MKQPFYPYESNSEGLIYEFESVSTIQTIRKIVVFSPLPENPEIFNLALGDYLQDGTISDLTVSNNSDMEKVMATVIQTMFRFFEKYPDNFLYFKGSTPQRTRLYRIIISRELSEAHKVFELYGAIDEKLEPFKENRPYDFFIIALK